MESYNVWSLDSFTQDSVFKVQHVVACLSTSFIFIAEWYSFVWIYHILFIHSSVHGSWVVSTFWLQWMMLLWTFVYRFLCGYMFSFILIHTGSGIAGSYGKCFLTPWGIARLFPKVAAPFYIPTSSLWGFQFLGILVSTHYYLSFWFQSS